MSLCPHGWDDGQCPSCPAGQGPPPPWPGPRQPPNRVPGVPLIGFMEAVLPPFSNTPEAGLAIEIPRRAPGWNAVIVMLSYYIPGTIVAPVHDFRIDLVPLPDGFPTVPLTGAESGYVLSARPRRYFGLWMDGYDGFPLPNEGGAGRPYAVRVTTVDLPGVERDFRVQWGYRPVNRQVPETGPC